MLISFQLALSLNPIIRTDIIFAGKLFLVILAFSFRTRLIVIQGNALHSEYDNFLLIRYLIIGSLISVWLFLEHYFI
jgi:hypothetical protein